MRDSPSCDNMVTFLMISDHCFIFFSFLLNFCIYFPFPIKRFLFIVIVFKTEIKFSFHYSFFPKFFVNCDLSVFAIKDGTSVWCNTISCIRLRHLLAPFPLCRPVVPFSVALLRCIPLPLARAKNSRRILAHSHLEIV